MVDGLLADVGFGIVSRFLLFTSSDKFPLYFLALVFAFRTKLPRATNSFIKCR